MTKKEANELRLIAADIIHTLWEAGESAQLDLLQMQAKASVDDLSEPKRGE